MVDLTYGETPMLNDLAAFLSSSSLAAVDDNGAGDGRAHRLLNGTAQAQQAVQGRLNRQNKFIREQASWTATEMEARGKERAMKALKVWPSLTVDIESVKVDELEDRKNQAAKYSVDKLEFDAESRTLFSLLRDQILGLGDDIVELWGPRSVTYSV